MKNIQTANINNKSSNYLSENLSKLMHFHHISGSDLARSLNVPYNTIHRILNGVTADPRISTLEQIADYFGVSLDFLLNKNVKMQHESVKIPVVSWDYIVEPQFINNIDRTTWERWVPVAQLEHVENIDQVFALESTKSMHPRFPMGTIFIVDAGEQAIDGDLILIRFKENNSISLRELVIDSPVWQLNPIIPGSSPLQFKFEEHQIVGIVTLTLIQTRNI